MGRAMKLVEGPKVSFNWNAPVLPRPQNLVLPGGFKVGFTKCTCCEGRGTYLSDDRVELCHACRRTGWTPDENTQKVINFFREWGDL